MAKTEKKANKKVTKYKKAPDAPKRFKSAFIIFSAEKHKEIKKTLLEEGRAVRTTEIAKMVSERWKSLDPTERKDWEDKADKDKVRYESEKAMYKGPWKIPSNKRKSKDPSAPKRPMSAFLAYSNSRRAALKREHPKSTNADLSRMLSKSWKELDPTERAVYMAEERKLREQYKTDMSEWRKKVAKEKKAEREEREVAALQAADEDGPSPPHKGMGNDASRGMESGWRGANTQQQQEDLQHHQFQQQQHEQQQQQMNDMTPASMFSNPYLVQAAAFGGAGVGQMMGNPYLANPFASQGYMQGAGNPALSLFGAQPYMPNAGMPGQMPGGGLYGGNYGGMGMNDAGASAGAQYNGQMQP